MNKIKPILPTLRERKRYLAFEIISRERIKDFSAVSIAFRKGFLSFLGGLGAANAGIMPLAERYDSRLQRGLIRVNNKFVNHLKAALIFVDKIAETPVIVRSVGVSGILAKAGKKYLSEG